MLVALIACMLAETRNVHGFAAKPDSTASSVEIVIKGRNGEVWQERGGLRK